MGGPIRQVLLISWEDDPYMQSKRIGLRSPSEQTLSAPNSQLILNWVATCKENHPLCQADKGTLSFPTRVIDVGPVETTIDPNLILSSEHKSAYIALSHCWGNSAVSQFQARTTTSNLRGMLAGFTLDSLPANFRDAIITTRRLGYQYLWIDSLCIIQDSADDWAVESAKMDEVYRNADLVIAAFVQNIH